MRSMTKFDYESEIVGYMWIAGIVAGGMLIGVPVLGIALITFSLLMFISFLKSDRYRAYRYYHKGLNAFDKGIYDTAYVHFKNAYQLNDENQKVLEKLIKSNIYSGKDFIEARMLIEMLGSKWPKQYPDEKIMALKDTLEIYS